MVHNLIHRSNDSSYHHDLKDGPITTSSNGPTQPVKSHHAGPESRYTSIETPQFLGNFSIKFPQSSVHLSSEQISNHGIGGVPACDAEESFISQESLTAGSNQNEVVSNKMKSGLQKVSEKNMVTESETGTNKMSSSDKRLNTQEAPPQISLTQESARGV